MMDTFPLGSIKGLVILMEAGVKQIANKVRSLMII